VEAAAEVVVAVPVAPVAAAPVAVAPVAVALVALAPVAVALAPVAVAAEAVAAGVAGVRVPPSVRAFRSDSAPPVAQAAEAGRVQPARSTPMP
jgi:hypothetical protein